MKVLAVDHRVERLLSVPYDWIPERAKHRVDGLSEGLDHEQVGTVHSPRLVAGSDDRLLLR